VQLPRHAERDDHLHVHLRLSTPLIAAADLAAALDSPRGAESPLVVLDVRWRLSGPPGRADYEAGHVPGAVFADLDADLAAPPAPADALGRRPGGRHPLPEPAAFEAAMRRLGVSSGSLVVVYDAADATASARAWWLLRYFGHDDVRVLDGGYGAWVATGLPVSTDVPAVTPGDFVARPGGLRVLDGDGAARVARDGVLLDARSAERYRGEVEPVDPVAGHVPGAVSAPTSGNVGPDGRLLPPAALRERFAVLGADGATPVAAYCGSGVTAAQEVLALAVAGVDAALYAGSWSDWVSDPERPVAQGSPAR
jgi:thiosulfate/3-mercaptopyruvate sulfurtransferase